MARTLYGLRVSPWTERAKWALDHHHLAFDYHEHIPMIGEVLLRRKAKVKKASVPLLDDGGTVVMGSTEIARHADQSAGGGAALFPKDKEREIGRFVELAETLADVGRAAYMKRVFASPEAQAEALPPFVPGFARRAFAPTTRMALSFLMKKHAIPTDVDAEVRDRMRPACEEIRSALGGRMYLLEEGFSFADMAIAATLHVVRPRDEAPFGPATRAAWTHDTLANDFADLLKWRDALYAKHRS